MARIRQIKPDFFRSEDVANLEPIARLLFIGLWTLADRDGRLLDRPRRIAIELFPYDRLEDKIDLYLGSLAARGLIVRYKADGHACIEITGFTRHQKPHPKEPASELPPAPPECECHVEDTYTDALNREESRLATDEGSAKPGEQPSSSADSGSLGSGSLGSGVGGETSASLPSKSPPAPRGAPIAEFGFRCAGKPDTWWLTQEQLAEWEGLYPSLDVLGECRKALAWTRAKPANRKTYGGMPVFLVNWFNREQNRGGSRNGAQSTGPPQGRSEPDPSRIGRQKIPRLPIA